MTRSVPGQPAHRAPRRCTPITAALRGRARRLTCRRVLRYGLLIAIALSGVLLFILASASGNTAFFERNYPILLAVNGVIAAALAVLVLLLVRRLIKRLRLKRFGARLTTRFAVAFALMGVLPGVLIYVVSTQFLSRSIESWFDVRVDRALDSGLTLGRAALDNLKDDVAGKARAWALELADLPEAAQLAQLNRLARTGRNQRSAAGVRKWPADRSIRRSGVRARAGDADARRTAAGAHATPVRRHRGRGRCSRSPAGPACPRHRADSVIDVEGVGGPLLPLESGAIRLRESPRPACGPAAGLGHVAGRRRALPAADPAGAASIAANAEALQNGYREYQELSLSRSGLKTIYGLTLTLTLLLSVFAAIAGSVLLASSMTAPLLQLAEGTKAVAEGNFRPVREYPGSDELNLLTQSFNAMTRQLTDARDAVEVKQREVENAKAYLERVLANLSAGVVVLDREFRLVTANFGASRILGHALSDGHRSPVQRTRCARSRRRSRPALPSSRWRQRRRTPGSSRSRSSAPARRRWRSR